MPTAFFKVLYCPDEPNKQMIAFIMDNQPGVSRKIRQSCVTVDEVEQRTGLDFFAVLDDDVESVLEATSDYQAWQ